MPAFQLAIFMQLAAFHMPPIETHFPGQLYSQLLSTCRFVDELPGKLYAIAADVEAAKVGHVVAEACRVFTCLGTLQLLVGGTPR